ncbi:MAG TPA: GNAT family N-acetyltransferase [Pyrinomonadaceae bacterium]|nr:GNAT family N-acetyltransferase [Pyrinomonadaceae bacterium]
MTKRYIEPIVGGRVRLRLLEESDLGLTLAWRNQDHIRSWFVHSEPLTEAQHRAWFERYAPRDDDFVFVIEETNELHKPVGQVSLYNIDWPNARAEFGRMLVGEPEATGKGLAKEATALAVEYAFGALGMKEIEAFIKSTNAASLAVLFSCGFHETWERDGLKRVARLAP